MVAKHKSKLVNNLLEVMKLRKVKVPQLSNETGIPKDRIYKWFSEGNSPKAEDEKIIEDWIKMEKVPHETMQTAAFGADSPDELKTGPPTYEKYMELQADYIDMLKLVVSSGLIQQRDIINAWGVQSQAREETILRALADMSKIDREELIREAGKLSAKKWSEFSGVDK